MPAQPKPTPAPSASASVVFPALAGVFFFLVIIKFGSPIVLDRFIEAPADASALFYEGWPPHWSTLVFLPVALAGLFAIQMDRLKFRWALALPLIWLAWELISASQTVSPALTKMTLAHFAVGVGLFYLGVLAGKGMANPWPIWAGIALALCWVMRAGMEQHFGGLEATRKMLVAQPDLSGIASKWLSDPDYIKRIASNRIFGTFGGYANSFAGGIILLLPVTLVFLWRLTPKVRTQIRIVFILILGGCGLGCLYWSGSKAGWLVALVVGLAALGHSALPTKWKRWVVYLVLIVGVSGFALKYAAFFHRERNSVGARFAYWRAALTVVRLHPWLGTGPGTFQKPYEQLKNPTDEMARLCHNDYLEQASDSGVFGLLSYSAMVGMLLWSIYRYISLKKPVDWLEFALWLGAFGLCLHSLVEFHLYVPALAWPMFFIFGWLFRRVINVNVKKT